MRVEFWGGPRDGEVIEVRDGPGPLLLPIFPDEPAHLVDEDASPEWVGILSVPIRPLWHRYPHGILTKRIAYWPGRSQR